MKKPSSKLWERQARIARFRKCERDRRRGKRQIARADRYIAPGELITAPRSFDILRGSGIEVVKFLRAVAVTVLEHRQQVRLNFKRTETFYPPAAILLYAEIDRVIAQSDLPKPVTILDPIQRRPREVLKQIGIHELTGDRCDTIPEREDVVYWKATKGATQSGEGLAILESVAERANRKHADQIVLKGVWRGVSEAVANVVDHAYMRPRADGFAGLRDTKWWMFTNIRFPFFTAAVCDLGCGYRATIDSSLPELFVSEIRSAFLGANRDALAIHTAMEYGRSGTRYGHRGKGSRDALSVLATHGAGELVIVSNTGWMRYSYENGHETERQEGSLKIDIKGTIIWWKLPLTGDSK